MSVQTAAQRDVRKEGTRQTRRESEVKFLAKRGGGESK